VAKWLDAYLSEDAMFGSWAEHVHGGWERRHSTNVLFLTFEEMKADLRGSVTRIAAFMGVELSAAELDEVVRQTTYQHMKSIGYKFDTFGLSPPWASPEGAMVRRGKSGGAAELLSATDRQRIDDYWRNQLEQLGSDFPFDDAFRFE